MCAFLASKLTRGGLGSLPRIGEAGGSELVNGFVVENWELGNEFVLGSGFGVIGGSSVCILPTYELDRALL